jgi:uncharacterized paraquat-inducible protein A
MLMLRIMVFIKSLIWHIYSGSPKTTTQQIIDRYIICKNCPEFDDIKSQCSVCGCNISVRKQFLNKLAWADQECPLGKWSKIIPEEK